MQLSNEIVTGLLQGISDGFSKQEMEQITKALEVLAADKKYNVFRDTFPVEGDLSIHNYKKHKEFFKAGKDHRERAFIAANRVGKSIAACYEIVCHTTGLYPDWWEGRKYTRPVKFWLGGDTASTCRDILQNKLLGNVGDFGSGMIPKECICDTRPRRNVPDAVEVIRIKHKSGGVSELTLKTYDQGREVWQGTECDGIFLDEECPMDIYGEAIIRTMTTGGFTVLTFTPLSGLTDVVLYFLNEDDKNTQKSVTTVSWWDVPHLKTQDIEQMLAATPPYLRDARSKGIPTIGSGKIYPVPESEFIVEPIQLPRHFPRAYGMDVGWNCTAAVWGALDKETDTLYIYDEYKKGEAEPAIHASAVKARGEWIPGVIDPAARGRSQHDGTKLYEKYVKEGLKISPADNAVEAGIYEVWQRLSTGRVKIFNTCTQLIAEMRLYRRDEKGKIVKKDDHNVDCMRYLVMSGIKRASLYVESLKTLRDNKIIPIKAMAWS